MNVQIIRVVVVAFLLATVNCSGSLTQSRFASASKTKETRQAPQPSPTPTPDEASDPSPAYQPTTTVQGDYTNVTEGGASFIYRTDDYNRVMVRKELQQLTEPDVPWFAAPEHHCFYLEDKRPLPAFERGPRYFYPSRSFLCVIPLSDPSVENFGKVYPFLVENMQSLRKLLRERPKNLGRKRDLPDLPFNNAGQAVVSKAQYLDFRSGSGILFITQYSQEMLPNPLNNEELTCNFQGLTKGGSHYVAARLTITHPSLPEGIDFDEHIVRDKDLRYLRRGEQALNRLSADSFQPSLNELKKLAASISVR